MGMPRLVGNKGRDAYVYPLLVGKLLANAAQHRGEIVSEGHRFSYLQFQDRVFRLASMLRDRGVRPGDTVAVMDWDSHRYLECYFAIPMMGAILQTVNVRLARDTIAFTLRQAGASLLLYHVDFSDLVAGLLSEAPSVADTVLLGDDSHDGGYEALLSLAPADFVFEEFDENAIATTFHTTGTTGDPKQVSFSHRQLVLHTLSVSATFASQPDGQSLRRGDVYMPITPMFHVHAWGMPFVATMLGLKQVYPGRYDARTLLALKAEEGVTFSHCVPTLLRMILDQAGQAGVNLHPWTMVIGGSALPASLLAEAEERGIIAFAGYGMSETGPIIAVARACEGEDASLRTRAGLPIPLVEARTTPPGRGELLLRAPWLTQGYGSQAASDELWHGGWLHTQDIAETDPDGGIRIVDRLKDVIKTGGEWVSSIDIETLLASHPAVVEAAVVAEPCPRWGERPVAFATLAHDCAETTPGELMEFLSGHAARGRISRYAIPDRIVLCGALPRTSVGKVDKVQLRQQL